MDFISKNDIVPLTSDFQTSYQLIWDENSGSERVTVTKVHVSPGRTNPRHIHETSEQIWIALKGSGLLLLENERTRNFSEGDIARFADGDVHGFYNNTTEEFIYISVTSPPINFRYAYNKEDV